VGLGILMVGREEDVIPSGRQFALNMGSGFLVFYWAAFWSVCAFQRLVGQERYGSRASSRAPDRLQQYFDLAMGSPGGHRSSLIGYYCPSAQLRCGNGGTRI